MNLTKPLLFATLMAAASLSFAQNDGKAPAPAHHAAKPVHAKKHDQTAATHHAKTAKSHDSGAPAAAK